MKFEVYIVEYQIRIVDIGYSDSAGDIIFGQIIKISNICSN